MATIFSTCCRTVMTVSFLGCRGFVVLLTQFSYGTWASEDGVNSTVKLITIAATTPEGDNRGAQPRYVQPVRGMERRNIRKLQEGCRPRDILISQAQISGVGLPRFAVHIVNSCTNPKCSISNIVVNCGHFNTGYYVNPNLFKRLNYDQGTCIVNNGQPLGPGTFIDFQYGTVFPEPMFFRSAQVSCWQ